MQLEEIFAEWEKDSQLDRTRLDLVALDIPKLHAKYVKLLSHERLLHKKYEADYKQLKLEKLEFYVDGPTQEQLEKGWELPAKGRIIKSDAGPYIEADKDIIKLSLRIGLQKEKIDVLTSIVDQISRLGFQVKSAIDWSRFMNGS
jgi:hypothetical protein